MRIRASFGGVAKQSKWWSVLAMSEQALRKKLAILKTDHRDLDAAIEALKNADTRDQLQIARLKKRKLFLRDQIAAIEDVLIPDIIA